MKKFLKESPAIWALAGLVITLILLGLAISSKDWTRSLILVVLAFWILICVKKDHTIWRLTKGSRE